MTAQRNKNPIPRPTIVVVEQSEPNRGLLYLQEENIKNKSVAPVLTAMERLQNYGKT